jgi:kynurenine formamidase
MALALLSATGCGQQGNDASQPGAGFDPERMRVVDLSHAYDENTIYWPTSPSEFELEVLHDGHTESGYYYSANRFRTPEHGGTHLDAPVHFAEGALDAAEIPVERLMGPAVVIDVTEEASNDPDYRLTEARIRAFEAEHGAVPKGAIVLLRTGWSRHWPDKEKYLGDDTPGDASNLHFPSYGEDAARYLVEERGAAVLGVDTASLDYGQSEEFMVHRVAGKANVAGLENLTNLDELPATGARVIALPMKIAEGSGGPVRAVAFVPKEE